MLKHLYARIVLWLIRPALECNRPSAEAVRDVVIDTIIKDAQKNGPVTRCIRGAL